MRNSLVSDIYIRPLLMLQEQLLTEESMAACKASTTELQTYFSQASEPQCQLGMGEIGSWDLKILHTEK